MTIKNKIDKQDTMNSTIEQNECFDILEIHVDDVLDLFDFSDVHVVSADMTKESPIELTSGKKSQDTIVQKVQVTRLDLGRARLQKRPRSPSRSKEEDFGTLWAKIYTTPRRNKSTREKAKSSRARYEPKSNV